MGDTTLLCVQRILHSENIDYDDAVSGVTRHYVRIARGYGPLAVAVHGLVDNGVHLVDASDATEYKDKDMRENAAALEGMLVAALSAREERATPVFRCRLQHKVVPLVDELGDTVWHPALASVNARHGSPMLILQYRDDEMMAARIAAYQDAHGESTETREKKEDAGGGAEEEEEEEGEYEEEEEDEDEESEISEEEVQPKRARRQR